MQITTYGLRTDAPDGRARARAGRRNAVMVLGVDSLPGLLQRTVAVIRRVVGVPDYDRYLSHMRQRHPEETPLSRAEFERRCLEDRYNRPGTRCC